MITYAASCAPAPAAASSTCSIVLSLSDGMSAAIMTPHGTPLAASACRMPRRRAGVAARGPAPPPGRRGAGLEPAGERPVERADRDEHLDEVLFGHRREQVEIALDQ